MLFEEHLTVLIHISRFMIFLSQHLPEDQYQHVMQLHQQYLASLWTKKQSAQARA
jgi:hypothetical protein